MARVEGKGKVQRPLSLEEKSIPLKNHLVAAGSYAREGVSGDWTKGTMYQNRQPRRLEQQIQELRGQK